MKTSLLVVNPLTAAATWCGQVALLLAETLGFIARGHLGGRRTVGQMSFLGADSLPVTLITLLFAGMVWGLQTAKELVRYGGDQFVGGLVAISVGRELGPVLTGIVVAARAGSAMSAELGSMVVTDQIDAMRAMAVSPVRYLVVPRLIASIVMLPLLTILADVVGAFGAFLLAHQAGISANIYLRSIQRMTEPLDLFGGVIKAVVFGAIIALIGCRQGLAARGGAAGVGRATTSAVVLSIVLIYGVNYLLSYLLYYLLF